MRVAITGASGLIGTALTAHLRADGHEVLRLVRGIPRERDDVRWDPLRGVSDLPRLEGVTGVVHLAGAGIADGRWTSARRQEIRDSRVLGTRTLVRALTALEQRPEVLVAGSAIGFYGSRGDGALTEDSAGGEGFLADVVRAWEAEAATAGEAGIRVATARTGLVMSPHGGAFARLLPLIRRGLGGSLGDGSQWWSWVTLVDEVAALHWLLDHPVSGPFNLTSPQPLPHREVVRALARQTHRPALTRVPAPVLRVALGEMATSILASQRVLPTRLLDGGFTFRHPTIESAARWLLGEAAA